MNEENEQITHRKAKLAELREKGNPFPNDFRPDARAGELTRRYGARDAAVLDAEPVRVRLAGRVMSKRVMGKAGFAHIQDGTARLQLYVQRDSLPEGQYNQTFKKLDIGDIIGVEGALFKTRTGELTVRTDIIRLLTKALRPLPEKFHGLTDQETRYRQRYLDLIVNETTRRTFRMRAEIIRFVRDFLTHKGFLEVETPMMQTIPGGALARPFVTHHNALNMDLYLRVAPELFLKRLVVGGIDRVFEINRNFRNEGISAQHNPEFTMLEFYQAYADYRDLMDLTEQMLREMSQAVLGSTSISYQGERYDLAEPFPRIGIAQAVLNHYPDLAAPDLEDVDCLQTLAASMQIPVKPGASAARIVVDIFEKAVETRLRRPTFVTGYPVEVSPLSRRNDQQAAIADRFELFVAGREIANGFSELNDPEDQAQRFRAQAAEKAAGDDEAMHYDADYIQALEHGLPPTAGEGIGIDRLVMLFTDRASIRDVLLFPSMRPE